MKIDDVSLTIFAWDNIPPTIYHQGAMAASGSNLGLLRIRTDAGLEGHAFLGSASNPAGMDGPQLIRSLKPRSRSSSTRRTTACGRKSRRPASVKKAGSKVPARAGCGARRAAAALSLLALAGCAAV